MSVLYYTNTLNGIFSASSLQSAVIHVSPLGNIMLIPNQPVFALLIFGLKPKSMTYYTPGEHANHYIVDVVSHCSFVLFTTIALYSRTNFWLEKLVYSGTERTFWSTVCHKNEEFKIDFYIWIMIMTILNVKCIDNYMCPNIYQTSMKWLQLCRRRAMWVSIFRSFTA